MFLSNAAPLHLSFWEERMWIYLDHITSTSIGVVPTHVSCHMWAAERHGYEVEGRRLVANMGNGASIGSRTVMCV